MADRRWSAYVEIEEGRESFRETNTPLIVVWLLILGALLLLAPWFVSCAAAPIVVG